MLIVALSVGVAIAAPIAFVILCLGIRREDRAALYQPTPTFAARQARRFTGLRTQHPGPKRHDHRTSERARADA
jgi:hypothetical protein